MLLNPFYPRHTEEHMKLSRQTWQNLNENTLESLWDKTLGGIDYNNTNMNLLYYNFSKIYSVNLAIFSAFGAFLLTYYR